MRKTVSLPILLITTNVAGALLNLAPAQAASGDDPASNQAAPSSTAGSPGTATGGDVSPAGDQISPDIQAESRAKMTGQSNWWTVSASPPQALTAQSPQTATPPTVASDYLNVAYYPQTYSYFCGPASGKMILKNIGAGYSAYNGDPQDQDHIGDGAHMNTVNNHVTSWSTDRFREGLNRWISGSLTGFYVSLDSPTPTDFKNALFIDVQENSHPFGADTVEEAGGAHYNNHPANETIGHWLTVSAFLNYGDTTRFSDPSTSVWPQAQQAFDYTTDSFVNTFLQSNGITW